MVQNTMKKLLLGLALLCWSAPAFAQVGPPNPILCNSQGQATIATATTTGVVNGVAGQRVYICGWHVTSTQAASTTFQIIQGTQGGPCGSPANLTPAFSVTSTAPSSDHVDYAQMQTTPGAQVCVVTVGATIGQAVIIWYVQY